MPKCTLLLILFCSETVSIFSKEISLFWHHLILDITDAVVIRNTLVRKIVYLLWFVKAFRACEDFCHCCSCFQKNWDKVLFLYLWVWIIYSDSLAYASVLWLHSLKEIEWHSEMLSSDNNMKHLDERITYQLPWEKYCFINCYNFTEFTENLPGKGGNLE